MKPVVEVVEEERRVMVLVALAVARGVRRREGGFIVAVVADQWVGLGELVVMMSRMGFGV